MLFRSRADSLIKELHEACYKLSEIIREGRSLGGDWRELSAFRDSLVSAVGFLRLHAQSEQFDEIHDYAKKDLRRLSVSIQDFQISLSTVKEHNLNDAGGTSANAVDPMDN